MPASLPTLTGILLTAETILLPTTLTWRLWVDGTRLIRYPYSNYQPGWIDGFDDWSESISTPGWHTVTLITDPDNTITESDETNNTWQRQFYWSPSAPYSDDMENGIDNWTASGLWHQVDSSSPYPANHSGIHSWWYGQDSTGDYDTGAVNSGDLTSTPIFIPSSGQYLRFWYRYETETQGPDWDQRWVQIAVDGGPFDNVLQLFDDPRSRGSKAPRLIYPDMLVMAFRSASTLIHWMVSRTRIAAGILTTWISPLRHRPVVPTLTSQMILCPRLP